MTGNRLPIMTQPARERRAGEKTMGQIYDVAEGEFNAVQRSEAKSVASHLLLDLEQGGRTPASPGTVMVTEPGEPHGMFARSDEPFVLVAANVYGEDHPALS